tara:strand:+ start:5137 stop:7023 length:1887 start_codon:yes stop_codon:yes gene_type:complete
LTGKKLRKSYFQTENFTLSERVKNILLRNNILTLEQLLKTNLRKLEGCGEKALKEIEVFINNQNLNNQENFPKVNLSGYAGLDESIQNLVNLKKAILTKLAKYDVHTIRDFLERESEILNKFKKEREVYSLVKYLPILEKTYYELHSHQGLREMNFLQAFDSVVKDTEYMSLRLKGLKTLEDCGKIAGVTRERIRQIEKKKINGFKKMIDLEEKFLSIFNKTDKPLFIEDAPLYNIDLAGVEKLSFKSPLLKQIFNLNSKLRIEKVKNKVLFSKKNTPTYDELLKFLRNKDFYKKEDIIYQSQVHKRYDLRDLLCDELQRAPSSVRGKINFYIPQILDDSDTPLKPGQIEKILKEKFNFSATVTAISNFLAEREDVYIFDSKGGWGFESKYRKFNENEILLIMEKMVRIFSEEKNKQLTVNYLLNLLLKKHKGDDYLGLSKLKKHDLNWILEKSLSSYPKLQKLGRGNWCYGEIDNKNKTYASLAENAIKLAEKPLSIKEIKKIISEEKSISSNFQLHMNRSHPNLIELESTIWGLKNRDVNLSKEDESNLLDEIKEKLLTTSKGFLNQDDLRLIKQKLNLNEISLELLIRVLRTNVNIIRENSPIFYLKGKKQIEIHPTRFIKDEQN